MPLDPLDPSQFITETMKQSPVLQIDPAAASFHAGGPSLPAGGPRLPPRLPEQAETARGAVAPAGAAPGLGEFKQAGAQVDGLTVLKDIPNLGSISSSFNEGEYTVLNGIREVPFSAFAAGGKPSVTRQTKALADQIKQSGEIKPLIVVIEQHNPGAGAYILEGSHRWDALQIAGKQSFPALVIVDHTAPGVSEDAATALGAGAQ
jgi:ParB-like nuclease domain